MIAEQAVAQTVQNEYEPVFMRQDVAASRVGISVRQMRRWIRDGRLKVYRPSARLSLVEWSEVERMVRESEWTTGKE